MLRLLSIGVCLCVFVCTFHRWGGLVFIADDHDNFPNWIIILNSMFPNWMMTLNSMFPLEDDIIFLSLDLRFSFLIVNQLIRDN